MRRLGGSARREEGMVTAEAALALGVLLPLLLAALWSLRVGVASLQVQDAARTAARAAARGDEGARVRGLAQEAAPAGSTVSVVPHGDRVTVTVERRFAGPGLLSGLAVQVRGRATSQREADADPGVAGPGAGEEGPADR